ncbi:S1/P1 nuclease [Henriciella algicola]|nr:S1/P1 nuclease [Henriciella algicola]
MRLIIGLVLAFAVFTTGKADAWGKYGHVTICEISYRLLTDTARERVNSLIEADSEYTSFNRACLEADDFPRTRPADHYVNYDRALEKVSGPSCGDANSCVISAISGDAQVLADETRADEERSKALILLGHWVGDVHQPMHVSFADDRGDNLINKRGRCGDARNLHAVWDNCLIEHGVFRMGALERMLGWARFTKAYRAADRLLEELTLEDAEAWSQSEPWEWAAESYDIVRRPNIGYCTMKSDGCWYEATRRVLGRDEDPRTIQMTQAYIDQHTQLAEVQLLKAGVRLAHVINGALDASYVSASNKQ